MAWQFAPGEILTATNLNAVTLPWNAVCQLSMSTTQSISNNTVTAIAFDTEDLDARAWHSGSLTTITPTVAGWYRVTVLYDWQSDSDYTRRYVEVQKNNSAMTPVYRDDPGSSAVFAGVLTSSLVTPLITMNGSSDTLRVTCFQTNTSTGANTIRALFAAELVYAS